MNGFFIGFIIYLLGFVVSLILLLCVKSLKPSNEDDVMAISLYSWFTVFICILMLVVFKVHKNNVT